MRKFKGGGSSAPSQQTVVQTNLPEYAEPYFTRLLGRAEGESLQGYTPYGGQRLADFTDDEKTAQAMTRGFATAGTPQALTDATNIASYYAGTDFGAGPMQYKSQFQVDPYERIGFEEGISRFMNPYQQNVTDIVKREAIRDSAIRGQDIASKAATTGGLGGYREAILQGERERNLGQRLDDIQAKGSQAAYNQAVQQLARERGLGLKESALMEQLGQGQEKLRLAGVGVDQAGAKIGLAGSQLLGDLAGETQKDALARISALAQTGEQIRAMEQAGDDMGYEDFLRQQNYTKDQLAFLSNILQGLPVQPNQIQSTYARQPTLFQSLLGGGLQGLGLYKSLAG